MSTKETMRDSDLGQESEREALGWRPIAALVLSLVALGASAYLTYTHFYPGALACPTSGSVCCSCVTDSPYAELFGVFPMAVLGLGFYLVMALINLPPMWRTRDERVVWARLALVVVGMGMVFYLLYLEFLKIHHICEYCTAVHVCTFLLFALVVSSFPQMLERARATRA